MLYDIRMTLIFGFISLVFSSLVISEKNTMLAVFYLVGTFISMSCLLLLLEVDYLWLLFIIVYVGALAILFLFVIMMINIKLEDSSDSQFTPIGIIIILIMVFEIYLDYPTVYELILNKKYIFQINGLVTNMESLGKSLYVWTIILYGSLVLLVAMVGVITLTLNHSLVLKRQDIFYKW